MQLHCNNPFSLDSPLDSCYIRLEKTEFRDSRLEPPDVMTEVFAFCRR